MVCVPFYSCVFVVVTLTATYQTVIRDVLYVGENLTLTCAISGAPAQFLLGIVFDDLSTKADDDSKKGQSCSGPNPTLQMP